MYFIIGTYRVREHIIGLKLYNPETGEVKMEHKNEVFRQASLGKEVYLGIEQKVDSYGEDKTMLRRKIFNVRTLDEVDENGNPINENHVRIPISTEGFGINTKIKVVDSMGKIEVIGYDELLKLIDDRKITGAQRNKTTITYHELCKQVGVTYTPPKEELTHE